MDKRVVKIHDDMMAVGFSRQRAERFVIQALKIPYQSRVSFLKNQKKLNAEKMSKDRMAAEGYFKSPDYYLHIN